MTPPPITVVVADDERPARRFLTGLLRTVRGVALVGEAASGDEAIALIREHRPHLALLDLQMPEVGGLEVVRRLPPECLPLVAFVTAFDEYAIEAFELNAVDYLLKPVQQARLEATLTRVRARLRREDGAAGQATALSAARAAIDRGVRRPFVERLPVRQQDKTVFVPVRSIASIVAEGELLHITTTAGRAYAIAHRLHAIEDRLDPRRFVRLSRSALVNVEAIARMDAMPGGTFIAVLADGRELTVSRIQSRVLRETLLRL